MIKVSKAGFRSWVLLKARERVASFMPSPKEAYGENYDWLELFAITCSCVIWLHRRKCELYSLSKVFISMNICILALIMASLMTL